jgi:flagella basal body P-ring formation protein FlgA
LALVLTLAAGGQARAEEAVVPVPRVTIYPGDMITNELIVDKPFPGSEDAAVAYLGREHLVGKVSRQTLLPGQPIPPNAVREPYLIKQGQAALVVFQSGSLMISTSAVPLQAGSIGETISLRNADSGTTIRGTVQADGTVRVGMP